MSQQQEGTSSTSAVKDGDTTLTNETGTFAYLQPYARSKFSTNHHILPFQPSDRSRLREEYPCSRSPRSVSPPHTTSLPSNKPLNDVAPHSYAFFACPTGCSPTPHILSSLPSPCWVLTCIWRCDMGVFRWGRAEWGWHRDGYVSL